MYTSITSLRRLSIVLILLVILAQEIFVSASFRQQTSKAKPKNEKKTTKKIKVASIKNAELPGSLTRNTKSQYGSKKVKGGDQKLNKNNENNDRRGIRYGLSSSKSDPSPSSIFTDSGELSRSQSHPVLQNTRESDSISVMNDNQDLNDFSNLEIISPSRRQLTLSSSTLQGERVSPQTTFKQLFEKVGYPGIPELYITKGDAELLFLSSYAELYSTHSMRPIWTFEHLTWRSLVRPLGTEDPRWFKPNPALDIHVQPPHSLFTRSGFDRGHLCPAADAVISQEAIKETYYMTNVAPQNSDLNKNFWNALEVWIRSIVQTPGISDVFVVTGTMYLEDKGKIGNQEEQIIIDIPSHWFKSVLIKHKKRGYFEASFIVPNEPIQHENPFVKYRVSLSELNTKSGLDLWNRIPKEKIQNPWDGKWPLFDVRLSPEDLLSMSKTLTRVTSNVNKDI